MSSNSMDGDEPTAHLLFDKNNEDHREFCDDGINDMVPILEGLCINDNKSTDLSSGFFLDTVPSSIKNFKGTSIADSNEAVSPIFLDDMSGKIWVNEVTKVAAGSENSLPGTEETRQVFPTNNQDDIQSQEVIKKASEGVEMEEQISDKTKETKDTGEESMCDESPMNLSLKRNLDHNNEAKSSSANKSKFQSSMIFPEKMKHVDPETGEIAENSSIIFSGTPGSNSIGKALYQSADEKASGIVFDLDSSKQSYRSSGIMLHSLPDTPGIATVKAAAAEEKRSRKIAASALPVSKINDNRRRHLSIFKGPFGIIDYSKINYSSDEDSKNSRAIGKESQINYRRKCWKTVKSSPRSIVQNHSDVEKEEKRPSLRKRKKTSSENVTETNGKVRKRCISEHNSETGENTYLVVRSRSLSPDLKNIHNISVTNPPTGNSKISQSRKRTNSDSHISSRVKFRRSSTSSADAENK